MNPSFDEVVTSLGMYDRLAQLVILDEVNRQRSAVMKARELLLAAYADWHHEDVPMEVLQWLNPSA